MRLHLRKTQVVPLGHDKVEEVKETLNKIDSDWSGATIKHYMVYLGAFLGPSAHEFWFEGLVGKLQTAAKSLAAMQLPTSIALVWYKVAVQSLLAYFIALRPPTGEVFKQRRLLWPALPTPPTTVFLLGFCSSFRG